MSVLTGVCYTVVVKQDKLAQWIIEQCEERGLSWAEASRRAGVSPNTISEIVNGTHVGIKRLLPLAVVFGVSNEFILRLAGHLPPVPPSPLTDIAGLQEIAEALAKLPPDAQRRVVNAVLALVQVQEVVSKTSILRQPAEPERDAT